MNAEPQLINRVAESELQSVALDDMIRDVSIEVFDFKDYLFQGLILREKDFREALKNFDWSIYQDKVLAVHCSTDAIIPMWAFMLVSVYATPKVKSIIYGTKEQALEQVLIERIKNKDWAYLSGKRVVVKGCSDQDVAASAYLMIAHQLQPYVQSLMFGEPCSTVPIFKRPRVI